MKRLAALIALIPLAWTLALPAHAEVAIQEVTSEGGTTAWLVEEHSLPFMALEIRFRGGTSLDRPGKRGAVSLMAGLLEEGAGDMDARAFAEAREALAAEIRFRAGDDTVSVSAKMLSATRDEAVELLRLALNEPRFDPDAVERVRAQALSGLRSRITDPDAIAGETFDALAFGDHPYGSYRGGTLESVAALSRDDVIAALGDAVARDRIYVAAVGDITAPELADLMDRLFAGLPATGAPQPEHVDFRAKGGLTLVDFDTPQSVAQFGHGGITRHDPDFYAAYVVNQIFGGGNFDSRLMDELREQRGLTYGVNTYLIPMFAGEYLLGAFSSSNDVMAEAIEVLRGEWKRMAEGTISADELEAAQKFLTGAYALRFDGNGPIARIMVGMQMQDLPIDYIATRNDRINAVTLDEANRVAARIYRPEDLRIVVVGRPEGLESE